MMFIDGKTKILGDVFDLNMVLNEENITPPNFFHKYTELSSFG